MAIDVAEFHVYAADWRPGRVDFLVDGEHVKTVHQAPDYPMQMMVAVFDFPDEGATRRRPTTCRCWPSTASAAPARRTADGASQRGQAELQLAQEVGEPALLVVAEGAEQPALVVEVRLGDGVDELVAGRGEGDQRPAPVVGVRARAR